MIKDEEKKNAAVPDIARYANSQNKVSELDLSSNNPILQKLEELSRTVYAIDPVDRNKQSVWYFERVKGQYRESLAKEPNNRKEAFKRKFPKGQVIIKSEVAKYMNTWNGLPFHVAKGAEKNYNIYLKAISETSKKTMPGRVYWEDIVANAILFRETDKLFGRKGKDAIGDTNIKAPTLPTPWHTYTRSPGINLTWARSGGSNRWLQH
ncbi:MAG: AIPR family protein [Flavobacteriales bacterium]|nr:AIPR family protein [Flavobacteriales bacterium]